MGPGGADCSCEIAGECLPKGSCVAIACALVAVSIVAVFLLAWLLQWLSAIPSEWILAKRYRRRSVDHASRTEANRQKGKEASTRPSSAVVESGAQDPQYVSPTDGGGFDREPLLEPRTADGDFLQGGTATSDQYGSFSTPVPQTENGRL